jgi:hypothetical protein
VHRWILALGCLLSLTEAGRSQAPPTGAPSLAELGELLKPHLVAMVPPVLYERSRNWGKTSNVPNAIHWHGLRPEIHKTPRNDGTWQKVRILPRDLPQSLELRLLDLRRVDKERQAFRVYLSFAATVEFEQQVWESGVRLYSGRTRARMRVTAWLDVENTVRLDTTKSFVPDLVVRFKVTGAKLSVHDVIVEHTAGVGGSAARLLGEALEGIVKEIEPGLERRVLDRAAASLVRAGDTREVRLGFGSLAAPRK